MTFWKRLGVAVITMVVASLIAALLWRLAFDTRIPGYLSGVIGGLAALGVWEFLRGK